MKRETAALVFGALGVLAWSISMVGTRTAAPVFGGLFVGFGRGVLGALVAGIVVWRTRMPIPAREHWRAILVVTAGSVLGFPLLGGVAMARVPASHGLLFSSLLPACTAVVAAVRHGEHPPRRFWWGAAIATAAVLRYAMAHAEGNAAAADSLLVVGMFGSAVAYAEGGSLAREIGSAPVLSWSLLFGLPVTLPGWLCTIAWHAPRGTPAAWTALVYVGIVSSYLGFLAWYRGMALGGIARTSQLQVVQPLIGLGWAALLLGEPLSLELVATALTVIVSVAWGRRAGTVRAAGAPVGR